MPGESCGLNLMRAALSTRHSALSPQAITAFEETACCLLISAIRVISLPRLHRQVLLFCDQADLAIARLGIALVGGVAEVVLRPQFFGDAVVDLIDCQLFRDFVETAAGFLKKLAIRSEEHTS